MGYDSDTKKEGSSKGFVVRDRRRFDDDGNERSVESQNSVVTSGEGAKTKMTNPTDAVKKQVSSEPEQNEHGEMNFSSFIMSLATQAMIQLGEMPAPEGFNVEIDISSAKQSIDILSIIQKKTKGNLEPEEDKLLEEILHSLRVAYLRHVGK